MKKKIGVVLIVALATMMLLTQVVGAQEPQYYWSNPYAPGLYEMMARWAGASPPTEMDNVHYLWAADAYLEYDMSGSYQLPGGWGYVPDFGRGGTVGWVYMPPPWPPAYQRYYLPGW